MRATTWLGFGVLLLLACPSGADAQEKKREGLPAAPKGFDTRRDGIEHGKLETVEYNSKSVGGKRKMVVYTPPGYSKDRKYPVFYLLHGAGDDETGWSRKGAANVILDNLYAGKKIAPMLVVMPNGFARAPGSPGGFGPGTIFAGAIVKQADTDKDGKLTQKEWLAAAKKFFEECDKDNKGDLDEKQIAEGINRMTRAAPGARAAAGAASVQTASLRTISSRTSFPTSSHTIRCRPTANIAPSRGCRWVEDRLSPSDSSTWTRSPLWAASLRLCSAIRAISSRKTPASSCVCCGCPAATPIG